MAITLRPIRLPDFEVPHARPAIPAETYAARADAAYRRQPKLTAPKKSGILYYCTLTNAGSDMVTTFCKILRPDRARARRSSPRS